ncbi:MAG: hypothetical protein Q3962_08940 [Corynebacterium sp.]|nr:hypothetical protein [Corynebacterium sp.]
MPNQYHQDFLRLYPEIDPTTPISINTREKISITVATAVCCYGIGYGNIPIALFGSLLIIFAALACGLSPRRRVRGTARTRFPDEPWAEFATTRAMHLRILFPIFWLCIGVVSVACLYFIPPAHAMWGGIISAVFAVLAVWFMPGMSTLWEPKPESPKTPPNSTPLVQTTLDTAEIPRVQ